MEDALAVYGDRPAALANDLTKRYEQVERAPLSTLLSLVRQKSPLKGEFIVVIAGQGRSTETGLDDPAQEAATYLAQNLSPTPQPGT